MTIEEYFEFGKTHTTDIKLTEIELEVLTHALGYYRNSWIAVKESEWRNYFDNGDNSRTHYTNALEHLVELGLMEKEIVGDNNVYHATDKGKEVARIKYVQYVLSERKKTKVGKRRWRAYMHDNDTGYFSDFGEWIRVAPMYETDWKRTKLSFGF